MGDHDHDHDHDHSSSPDEWATTKQACRDELVVYLFFSPIYINMYIYTSSNQWLGSAGARLLQDARHKRHRSLHGSTCRMDSNATKARSTLRRVAEQLLILANEGQ